MSSLLYFVLINRIFIIIVKTGVNHIILFCTKDFRIAGFHVSFD